MRYVLFICNHNAGRSQMAQAFFERYPPEDVRAESAGSTPARADWAVTMGCGDVCPYVPTTVEAWDVPDPAGLALEQVRPIRDAIEARVRELIETKLDAIRSDATAHRFRLQHLLPPLADEFEGSRSPEEIRACADAVLSRFDDDPVRSYVQVLAHRRTRECLREDVCSVLAGP